MALLTASAFCRWPTIAPDARRHEAQAPAILPLVALQLARVLASPGPGMRGRPRCAKAPADLPFVALQLARVLASPGPHLRGLAMKAMPFLALQLARVLASPGPGMRGRPRCAQAPADLPFVALQLARVLASPGPRQLCSTASVSLPSGACRAEP
jgi:hypothetical protein